MVGKAFLAGVLVAASVGTGFAAKTMYGAKAVGGDTVAARDGDNGVIVRLYGIDAPDEGQVGFKAAEDMLKAEAVDGRTPIIVVQVGKGSDQYGRIHAIVTRGGVCVNKALVAAGAAVVDPQECKIPECKDWLAAQDSAKAARIGFWSIQGLPMPWEERRAHYREVESKDEGFIEGVQYTAKDGRVYASIPQMPHDKFGDYPRPVFVYGGGTTIINRTYVTPAPYRPSRYRVY